MTTGLMNDIIFLHGLSGSGKGEIRKKLVEQYFSQGYETFYISSGTLFRAALSNPVIAEQVRSGYFLDTLGAIMPGIENAFEQFIKKWVESEGKAVIILDGVIRRGTFTNKEGVVIPSQFEQISLGAHKVIQKLDQENVDVTKCFPEYEISNINNEGKLVTQVAQILRGATHIVVDVLPEDAETQMKIRTDKEINSIRLQLQEGFSQGRLGAEKIQKIEECISRFQAILHGGVTKDRGNLVYTSSLDWMDRMDADIYPLVAAEVGQIRENIASIAGLEKSATLTESFGSIGVSTELRDDDLSPIGRSTRINNYIKKEEGEGRQSYEAGFATQALCEDLEFQFIPDGSFHSEAKNCIVIPNGQSKGIGLEQFRAECGSVATQLYRESESKREITFKGQEGQRINRERGF